MIILTPNYIRAWSCCLSPSMARDSSAGHISKPWWPRQRPGKHQHFRGSKVINAWQPHLVEMTSSTGTADVSLWLKDTWQPSPFCSEQGILTSTKSNIPSVSVWKSVGCSSWLIWGKAKPIKDQVVWIQWCHLWHCNLKSSMCTYGIYNAQRNHPSCSRGYHATRYSQKKVF